MKDPTPPTTNTTTTTDQTQKLCYLRISIAGAPPRTIVFSLHTQTCPKTCANFLSFCTSPPSSPQTYHNTLFHRIIPGFMVQGGDYENKDGTGGEAFYGDDHSSTVSGGRRVLQDETFLHKHTEAGILSMANAGPNTAGSQFFITLGRASHLDGKHVVFGRVVKGMDVVEEMGSVETEDGDRPVMLQKIVVRDCGEGDGQVDGGDSDGSELEQGGRRSRRTKEKKRRKKPRRRDEDERDRSSSKRRKKSSRSSSSRKRSRRYSDSESSNTDSSVSSGCSDGSSERRHKRRSKKSSSSRKRDDRDRSKRRGDGKDDSYHRKRKDDEDDANDKISKAGGDSSTEGMEREKKHRKSSHSRKSSKKKSKRSRRYYSSDSSCSSSSSSSASNDRRRHTKSSSSSHSKKRRKDDSTTTTTKTPTTTTTTKTKPKTETKPKTGFGAYGILRLTDLNTSTKAKLSFEIWLAEVKGVPQSSNIAKWEMTDYSKEFIEDFNTATFPHIKYYDYGKWEMEEYTRQKEKAVGKKGPISDEFMHVEEMRKNMMEKKRKEMQLVASTMNRGKVKEMKRQAELKAQLENAYRVGDQKKVKQIQKRLEPDEKLG